MIDRMGGATKWKRGGYAEALLLGLLAVAIWGGTPVATKIAVRTMDPMAVTLWRTLAAAGIAVVLALVLRPTIPRGWRTRGLLLLSAISGYIAFPWIFALGIERTSAVNGTLLLLLAPVLTGLMAIALGLLKVSRLWVLGVTFAILGAVVLVINGSAGGAGQDHLAGDTLVFLSVVFAAIGYLSGSAAAREVGALSVTLLGHMVAALLLLPALPWSIEAAISTGAHFETWLAIAYLAFFSSLLAYIAWYRALAVETGLSQVQFFQGIFGLLAAMLILGEVLSIQDIAGAGLIVLGVIATQQALRRKA